MRCRSLDDRRVQWVPPDSLATEHEQHNAILEFRKEVNRTMDVDTDVRQLCHTLVRDHAPHELDLFDAVWRGFWRGRGIDSLVQLKECADSSTFDKIGGLSAVGPGDSEGIDTLHIVSAISETMADLLSAGTERDDIAIEDISTALHERVCILKTPEHVRVVLVDHGIPMIGALLGLPINAARPPIIESDSSPTDPRLIFVRWQGPTTRSDGEEILTKPEAEALTEFMRGNAICFSSEKVRRIWEEIGSQPPDIYVDEPGNFVSVRGGPPESILGWRDNAGGMLWLVFRHANDILTYGVVRTTFGLGKRQRVSHLRRSLAKKIDTPIDRLIPRAEHSSGAWTIPGDGWTFVWIHNGNVSQSLLAPNRANAKS